MKYEKNMKKRVTILSGETALSLYRPILKCQGKYTETRKQPTLSKT